MALFPITRRTDMDLALTRDRFDTKQFDKETLDRIEKQESNYERKKIQKIINEKIVGLSALIPLAVIAYLVLKK
tara:strand:- start:1058 stop:1279 length:222 start_codon:yes stop_codon:yes gene_type:complete